MRHWHASADGPRSFLCGRDARESVSQTLRGKKRRRRESVSQTFVKGERDKEGKGFATGFMEQKDERELSEGWTERRRLHWLSQGEMSSDYKGR